MNVEMTNNTNYSVAAASSQHSVHYAHEKKLMTSALNISGFSQ